MVTGSQSFVIKTDGTVWGWGNNNFGQLGDGTKEARSTPVKIIGLTDITQVVSGGYTTIALKNDGTVWAWGGNVYGELGNGTASTKEVQYTPIQISGLTDIVAIGQNNTFTHVGFYAIKQDGTLWSWGCQAKNIWGDSGDCPFTTSPHLASQIGEFSDVINFQSGGGTLAGESINSNYVLKNDGTVWAWGSRYSGQLGDGTNTLSDHDVPEQVGGLSGVKEMAVEVQAGGLKVFALKNDGTVWGWGNNYLGQLGTGMAATTVDKPTQVRELTGISKISVDTFHTLALKNDGTVWAWGSNNLYGAIGVETRTSISTPVQLVDLHNIVDIQTNGFASYALKADGTIWGWGSGYLKAGGGAEAKHLTPIQICNLPGIINIVFRPDSLPYLLRNDGTVWRAYFDGCTQL